MWLGNDATAHEMDEHVTRRTVERCDEQRRLTHALHHIVANVGAVRRQWETLHDHAAGACIRLELLPRRLSPAWPAEPDCQAGHAIGWTWRAVHVFTA